MHFFEICSRTKSASKLLGILLMTTYFFLAWPSNPFGLRVSLACFLVILLNSVATLTVLLFKPTFFVLSKPPHYFRGNVRAIFQSLGPEARVLFARLSKFCQVNLPGLICSRVANSFRSFACLAEVKPLNVGASYGDLDLF